MVQIRHSIRWAFEWCIACVCYKISQHSRNSNNHWPLIFGLRSAFILLIYSLIESFRTSFSIEKRPRLIDLEPLYILIENRHILLASVCHTFTYKYNWLAVVCAVLLFSFVCCCLTKNRSNICDSWRLLMSDKNQHTKQNISQMLCGNEFRLEANQFSIWILAAHIPFDLWFGNGRVKRLTLNLSLIICIII